MSLNETVKSYWTRSGQSFRNGTEFLRDVRKELNNVTWPSRRELTGTTMVVIVAVFFFGFYLWVVDQIVYAGMQYIYRIAP